MEDSFQYRPLPITGWIRLMVIENALDVNAAISCRLQDHATNDDLGFEALSYTWGDEPAEVPIFLGGKRFLCRINLVGALRALRRSDKPLFLWVDAICINQADESERNSQVLQMRDVYCKAERVNVWLGGASAGSDRGMDLLASFSKRAHSSPVVKVGSTWRNESVDTFGATPTLSEAEFTSEYASVFTLFDNPQQVRDLDEAVNLLRRSWWTRMWTLQEGVLGGQVFVYCGFKTVPLESFFDLAYFIYYSLNFQIWKGSPLGTRVAIREVWRMADLRDHFRGRGHIGLLLALDSSWNRTASDPKDKVIGLLGLLGDHNDMKPDYAWSIDKVYRAAFGAIISETQDLGFLGLISDEPSLRNKLLPSWIPDLELHTKPASDYISSLSKIIFNPRLYNACNHDGSDFRPSLMSNDDSVLVVHGRLLDTITTLGAKAPGRILVNDAASIQSWMTLMETTLEQWLIIMPRAKVYHPTNEPSFQVYWRCVMADLKQGPLHQGYDSGKPKRLDDADLQTLLELDTENGKQLLLSYWASFCVVPKSLRLIEQLNRRFFVTMTGYIGLGPEWLQPDDSICILETGRVAYALRKVDNNYWTYVGECYVHGVMDGEIARKGEQDKLLPQTFCIQ